MTTATTIRIRNGRYTEIQAFITRTALADKVMVAGADKEWNVIWTTPRPSSGELILWDCLDFINGGDLPNMALARQILDGPNYAVVAETVRRVA